MPAPIRLPAEHREALAAHAERHRPDECCALLLGRAGAGGASVEAVFLAENARPSPSSFAISGGDLIRGYAEAEAAGLGVVGIFHSHPGSEAYPSPEDVRYMRGNPVAWVICGADGRFRAYRLDGGVREVGVLP